MKKLIISALLFCPLFANAVSSIKVEPIENRALPSVQNVRSAPHDLPIITWGGDIATVLANGNQSATQANSLFKDAGLSFRLKREDVFEEQIRRYLSGETPYIRGTMSMINMAAAAAKGNDSVTPVVFYQLTWSNGGDALVVKEHIKTASDLCGKTIAMNYDGPHLNYANKVLTDAGCDIAKNTFVWTKDLTGTDESPSEALREASVDAAFVIIPDALALTSGGNVGNGSEDSIRGAKILMSTKTANRVISDVYAVRNDYYQRNKQEVETLAATLFKAQEMLQALASQKGQDYQALIGASAGILLDAPDAIADTEGLLLDAEISGFSGNMQYFQNANNFRNFEQVVLESAAGVQALGIIQSPGKVLKAELNYALLSGALSNTQVAEKPRFDATTVARVVERRQKQNTLSDDTIFEFEVYFKPNQKVFNESLYEEQFQRVLELAATYGGAVITVEGHSDPMAYLRKKKDGSSAFILNNTKQSAKNLSFTRAQTVRDAIIGYGGQKGGVMDASQFAVIGHGIANPNTGLCGVDPCAPKTEQEWLSNMRVVFRIIQVEAEESVFAPL
ncbi:ABC transporter substrate-binding protein [Alteromonas macleodii]|uniref:OmpA family protein n=1 Tax=Alteromonas macleodii TaxID=28108 RepID=A0AB36FKV8_ALTMA|nr:ABC transporter substrate-binding protein [Alteromonas macleodii]OES24176.1 ompA family protein [Alteromonas macleodii]OES24810.1 ompA family protein [Alteromonas macleodii]OES25088.1 ompA family protein [Alteromonas macleodii]OES39131.1 ompA family protein [Alteromonas macleodii]